MLLAGLAILIVLIAASLAARGYSEMNAGNHNSSATTNASFCAYGYVCGMKSAGCALPDRIYNCPNMPLNASTSNSTYQNGTLVVSLAQELNNSAGAGFTLNRSIFYAASSPVCSKELISGCDNNEPSQFVCINSRYSGALSGQYKGIYANSGRVCPEFLEAGNVYCGTLGNYCVVYRSNSLT